MKLIDNRYKIENFIEDGGYYELYKTTDLWNEENVQSIKIYNSRVQNGLIDYYIDEFKFLSNIRHESLLSCNKFSLIKTIDAKSINVTQYYTVTEFNDFPSLNEIMKDLDLNDRLKIILQVILVIDFLHFRGVRYRRLNPYNIFVTNDKKIKIADLSTIMEKEMNNQYKELATYFISPDYLINKVDNKENDYYSIGTLIKFLLSENFLGDYLSAVNYNKDFKLKKVQKNEMNKIVSQLMSKEEEGQDFKLIDIVDKINLLFDLNYDYDIITPRNVFSFQNQIVGRQNDIKKILEIDKKIINKNLDYKGMIIRADEGVGKTRLIDEIGYQLKIRGRNLYSVEVVDAENKDFLYISEILKQSIKDAPSDLMEKYRDELSKILPELRISVLENTEQLERKTEIFRLYNRITNYFNELSKEKIIYIVIDNLHYVNNSVLMLIDYLVRNIKSSNMFFIFSFENNNKFLNPAVEGIIQNWIKEDLFNENVLYKLSVQEVGEMLKHILGMAHAPMEFASALFKEGEGNPKYIEYSIKDLFSINKLFISKKGTWFIDADNYSEIKFAKDMQGVLTKQLEAIKEEYYDIFKVMSIFNDIISKRVLLEMMDEDNTKVGETLDKLIGLKLLDEKVADWGYGYSINNIEFKKTIYDEIPQEEKINLHNRASNILGKLGEENYMTVIEELLLHLEKSNQPKRALKFIFDNAKDIKNKYSYTILYLWEKAYEIVKEEPSEVKLDILEKILNIYYLKGIGEKTEQFFEEYQRDAEELNDYKHIINYKFLQTDNYFRTAKPELGLKLAEEIGKIAEEHSIIEGKIISIIVKSRFKSRYGEVQNLEPDLKIALELSQIYGIDKYKGNIFNLLGLNNFMNGNTEKALSNYEKSVYHHQRNGDYIDAAKPINNMGSIYAEKYGNNEKAMEHYKKGLEIAYKYGFRELEMVFLNNMSEIFIKDYEFDKAIEHIESSRKIAVEVEDINIEFLANVNIGIIQLMTGDYKNMYETYKYLKGLHEIKGIIDVEIDTQYMSFLGSFYGILGKFDKSIYYSNATAKLCKEFNFQEYLKSKSRIIYMEFLKDKHFNKVEIEEIRKKYKETMFISNRRIALLNFAIISFISGDLKYSEELLEEDKHLSKTFTNDFVTDLRKITNLTMQTGKPSIDKLINLKSKTNIGDIYCLGSIINIVIGFKLFNNGLYEESIKYFLDSLDDIYKSTLKIPNFELQTSFIKSRYGDLIKQNIVVGIKKLFNKDLEYSLLKDVKKEDLYSYFDAIPIFEILDNDDISKIIKLEHYGDAIVLSSTEDLISNLTGNFQYNLDLIINYISKEALAKIGMILSYDDELRQFVPVSAIGNHLNYKVNMNILNLAAQDKKGILINNTIMEVGNKRYKQLLTDDVKGIICVPIFILEDTTREEDERRNDYKEEQKIEALVYLETDKSFNRFDSNIFNIIMNLSYLIYINLENNKLRSIATTDKLTGVFTRKHYEFKFEQLLNDMRLNDGIMSVIMLDIDNFKSVNDTYGHRKGDEVLKLLGVILKTSVRSSDIVARYGGEEFIILLRNTSKDAAVLIAEKIRQGVEDLKVPGIVNPITISLGISLYPTHSRYKEELIERADQALYYAKEMGKNRVTVWNVKMTSTFNRADKLAGILTGNMNEDNRKVLAMMDIIELIKKNTNIEEKIFIFLGILLNTIDGELATLVLNAESKKGKVVFSRNRLENNWVVTPRLNYDIIGRVSYNLKGEFLIDWDDINSVDPLSGLPNWKSVMVLPLIKDGVLKGIIYISVPIQLKEFCFDCFNISKSFVDIFAGLL